MSNFSKLGLSQATVDVLNHLGFENPTPIQEQAIPLLLSTTRTDFIGIAQTGTGKTAAFGLPLIEMIDGKLPTVQALIMAPTRELGQQTAQQLKEFSRNDKSLNVEVVYGGAAISNQIKALRRPTQILVATPGRLIDLIKRRAVDLKNVQFVILDEADEMLNMGFKEAIDEILEYTPEQRAIWLFSATMPSEIRKIVKKYMDQPAEISVNTQEKTNKDISHQFVTTKTAHKIPALRRFLDLQPEMRGVMFCRTKRETQKISDDLGNMGYGVEALHGDLSQAQRDAVMKRFKARSMQLLIATDVAARGIDVSDLTHVLHHTLPDQLEGYTHRSGRTGRAGKKGISLAFINPREGRRIAELEKKNQIKFERIEVPSMKELKSSRINHWANLIVNTKVDKQAEGILQTVHHRFEDLSKDDLLKRLITTQLDHVIGQGGEEEDLNEAYSQTHQTAGTKTRSDYHTYFVNLGTIDGVTKADLIHFLSDISGIKRKHFGHVTLQKNCGYFEISNSHDQGLSEKFSGIEIEGREIRVNRDDEGKHHKKSSPRKRPKSTRTHSRREKRRIRGRRR